MPPRKTSTRSSSSKSSAGKAEQTKSYVVLADIPRVGKKGEIIRLTTAQMLPLDPDSLRLATMTDFGIAGK